MNSKSLVTNTQTHKYGGMQIDISMHQWIRDRHPKAKNMLVTEFYAERGDMLQRRQIQAKCINTFYFLTTKWF